MHAIARALVDLSAPVADAGMSRPASAIGAAAGYEAAQTIITPRRAVELLRLVAADIAAMDVLGAQAAGMQLAARCAVLAHAVRAATSITFESREQAEDMRRVLDADLAAALDVAADSAAASPHTGGALWSALAELRAQLSRDMHETIGRLPAVLTIRPPAGISTWLIAQHFAGDDPRDVVAMFADIVQRNRLPHPGLTPDRELEVLP